MCVCGGGGGCLCMCLLCLGSRKKTGDGKRKVKETLCQVNKWNIPCFITFKLHDKTWLSSWHRPIVGRAEHATPDIVNYTRQAHALNFSLDIVTGRARR